MRRLLLPLTLASLCLLAVDVHAARPGLLSSLRSHVRQWQTSAPHRTRSYSDTYRSLNARYPKYIGAFHYSYFRDLGVPPGDVGLRGNGLYAHPW